MSKRNNADVSEGRKSKYFKGVQLNPTSQALDFGENPKYQSKRSTLDPEMYNSEETGFDILGWVSFEAFFIKLECTALTLLFRFI